MPAEADLLCEYFISSKLNKKKATESVSAASVLLKLSKTNGNNNGSSFGTATFATNTNSFEAIDFVKYDKNPMDYLKSKYQLLNSSSTAPTSDVTKPVPVAVNSPLNDKKENQLAKKPETTRQSESDLCMSWSKLKKNGIGLYNIGNNCYLNATLQCLAYTPPFSQWLITRPHANGCRLKKQKGFCSMCDVERIINDIFNCSGCAKPNSLCMNIKKISTVFGVGRQEDASEFFTTLLESMGKSLNFSTCPSVINKHKVDHSKKRQPTILDDIFSFQFRSRVTCSNCGRQSDTIENNNTWPIDVKHNTDIRKGMIQFLREEILDGHNAYKCDNCHKKTRATKKYSIRKAPNVLVVHLKRFDFSVMGKLSHHVSYPELLNLKNLTQTPTSLNNADCDKKAMKSLTYKLYGVLVHLGHTSRSGHYYSYVKGPNETWFRADDSRVNKVQTSEALNQKAYILFYQRMTPQAPVKTSIPPEPSSFNLNAKSPHLLAKLNASEQSKPTSSENGIPISRESAQTPNGAVSKSSNLLNDLITTTTKKPVKEKQAYSYGTNPSPAKTSNESSPDQNGSHTNKPSGIANGFSPKQSNGIHTGNGLNGKHVEEDVKLNGDHAAGKLNGSNSPKETKLSPKKKLKRLNEKILALKATLKVQAKKSPKKEQRLQKFLKRRKTLRKLIKKKGDTKKAKLLKVQEALIEGTDAIQATRPVFTSVSAELDKPLSIEKFKAFSDESADSNTPNALKSLKHAATVSAVKTWDEKESSLLVVERKGPTPRKRQYSDEDDVNMDSDEYNEDFDKPYIKEKKPKFLKKKNETNGFHAFTHGNGQLKQKKKFSNNESKGKFGRDNNHQQKNGHSFSNGSKFKGNKKNFNNKFNKGNNRHKPYNR